MTSGEAAGRCGGGGGRGSTDDLFYRSLIKRIHI